MKTVPKSCPQVLDKVAVGVDLLRAGNERVGALGRDGGTCAQVPDALAKSIGSKAPVTDDPARHVRQTAEQPRRKGQFMRLTGGERERDGAPAPVRDHTGFCAIAAATAAKRLDRRNDRLTSVIDALLTTACIFVIANRLTD